MQQTQRSSQEMNSEEREPAALQIVRDPGAIELPRQIHVDARTGSFSDPPRQQPASRARFAKCGNCMEKIPLSGDAEEDHHRAMLHKDECRFTTDPAENARVIDEWHELIREHDAQDMQREYREAARSGLAAPHARPMLAAPPAPARWWQFWKWFK
jgi:hypothetical protein